MQSIKAIFSSILIPIILWAGMGFSLNRHYCLGMLVDEAWYYVSDQCKPNHNDQEVGCTESIDEFGSCCSDQWLSIGGLSINSSSQDQEESKKINFKQISHALSNTTKPFLNLNEARQAKNWRHEHLPKLSQNIIIAYQRFLI
ncbi:MAG: hypothetical protein DA405_00900 [Bacteroidetes bacterium]|nr:MAG: hypothetical protein DA405_00900 [Bacteroidota bacterium]